MAALFAQDQFTERLINLFTTLVKKGAIVLKKEFCDLIEVKQSSFNAMERCERNYPRDASRRERISLLLLKEYGANPKYLEGKSEELFLREPEIKKVPVKEEVPVNFYSQKQKQQLQQERDMYKAKAEELEGLVQELETELQKYKKKTGGNKRS